MGKQNLNSNELDQLGKLILEGQRSDVLPSDQARAEFIEETTATDVVNVMSERDFESFKEAGIDILPSNINDRVKKRAEEQGVFNQITNSVLSIVPKATVGLLGLTGKAYDIDKIFRTDPIFTKSSFDKAIEDAQEYLDQDLFPVYRENPDETFNFSDSGWWFDNYRSVTSSALSYAAMLFLSGKGGASLLKGAMKGNLTQVALKRGYSPEVVKRMMEIFDPLKSKATKRGISIVSSIFSNHLESAAIAADVGQIARRNAIERGLDPIAADKIAGESSAMTYNANRINALLQYTMANSTIASPMSTRQLLKRITARGIALESLLEGGQEYVEETINHVSQKRGEYHSEGKEFGFSEALSEAFSKEGMESGFWGLFGGIHQSGFMTARQALPLNRTEDGSRISSIRLNNREFDKQYQILEEQNKIMKQGGAPSVTDVFMSSKQLSDLTKTYNNLLEAGNIEEANKINELRLESQAWHAFESGTAENLIEVYEELKDAEGEALEEFHDTDPESKYYYKKQAQKAIDTIKELEIDYIESEKYLNKNEVFGNMVDQKAFTKEIDKLKQINNDNKAEGYNSILEMQEDGSIPKSVNVKVSETIEGDERVGSEMIKMADLNIVIDPDTLQVMEDENLPSKVVSEVNDLIANTEEYQKFLNSSEELSKNKTALASLKKLHKQLISPSTQEALLEEENKNKILLEEEAKLSEKAEKEKVEKKARKEKVAAEKGKVVGDELQDTLEKEEKRELTGPELEDKIAETGEEVEYPSDEETGGVEVVFPDDFDPEAAYTSGDKESFVDTETEEDIHESKGTYTESTNTVVDETVKGLDDKTTEDFSNTSNDPEGNPVKLDGVKYAPNLLAYLSREYKEVIQEDPETGEPTVKLEDVNNKLLDNLDLRLTTELFEGSEITLEVQDDPDIEMYNPFYDGKNKEPKFTTWGYVKEKLDPDQHFMHVPIGAVINEGEKPAAYLHDPSWIYSGRVDGSVVSLEQQEKDLLALRKQVIEEEGFQTVITNKGFGTVIRTHDGSQNPVSEVFSDKDLSFAIVKEGELITSKDDDGDTKDLNIINRESITAEEGIYTALIPLQGKQASDKDAPFLAVPLRRAKMSEVQVNSAVKAVEIWWKSSQQNALTEDDKKILNDPAMDQTFIDEFSGLVDYLKSFINVKMLDSSNARSDIHDQLTALRSKDESARILGEAGASLYFGKPGMAEEDINFINSATPAEQLPDLLTKLKEHLAGMHINADMSNDQKEGDFIAPVINNDGSVTPHKGTYGDFLRDNSTTNLLSFQDKAGNYIYTIQHTIEFEKDNIEEAPFEADEDVEDVGAEVFKGDTESQKAEIEKRQRVADIITTQLELGTELPVILDSLAEQGLVEKINGSSFFQQTPGRDAIVFNINGAIMPVYRSSKGTGSKEAGEWYPFFFNAGDWLVKGASDSYKSGYGNPIIKQILDTLNKNYSYSNPIAKVKGDNNQLLSLMGLPGDFDTSSENNLGIFDTRNYAAIATILKDWQSKLGNIDISNYQKYLDRASSALIKENPDSKSEIERLFSNVSKLFAEIGTSKEQTQPEQVVTNTVTYNNREYTVEGDKIFNAKGKEVYKKDNKTRRDILELAGSQETEELSATESIIKAREEEGDPSKVVTEVFGEDYHFDLENMGDKDSLPDLDDLPGFSDPTYEDIEDITRLLTVPGLTYFQSKAAVDFLTNTINKTAYKASLTDEKAISKSDILNKWQNTFANLAAHAEVNGFATATFFRSLVDNWSDYTKLVDKALITTRTIKEEGADLDPQAFVAVGADLEKKKHDDGALSVDSKKGASPSIKRFLSSMMDLKIEKGEEGEVIYKPVTTIGGLKKYVGWDTAYNTLKPLLSGSVANIDSQIKTLKTYQEAHPWLNGLIKALKENKGALRYEFASSMAQHMLDMRTTLYSVDEKGNYSMLNASTNINAVGREVQDTWKENAKSELFVTSEDDFNDYTINPEMVDQLIEEYTNFESTNFNEAFDWLAKMGIKTSKTTREGVISKGIRQGRKTKTIDKFFLRGGLFNTVFNELKRHKSGLTLSKSSLYSNSAVKALAVSEAMHNPVYYSNNFRDGENKSRFAHTANKYLMTRLRDLKRNPERVEKLSKVGFNINSDLHKAILDNKNGKDSDLYNVFKVFYNDTLRKRDSRKSGITNSKATPAQLEQMRLGNFFNAGTKLGGTGKVTKRIAILNYMNTSDKKVPMSYSTIAHNTAMTRDGSIGSSTINAMYDKIVLPEIKRALFFNSNKNDIDVKGYADGAGQFLMLPELNSVKGVMVDGKMNPNILSDSKIVSALKAKLNEYVEDAITQKLEEWEKFEIGGDTLAWIDKDYLNTVKAPKENKVRYAAADYIVNSMLGNAEVHKVFAGDPALYFKSKHFESVIEREGLSPDTPRESVLRFYNTKDWIQETKDTYDNVSKRLAADIAPGVEPAFEEGESRIYKQAYLKDIISKSDELTYLTNLLGPKAKDYAKINEADAQEYTTLKEHLFVLKGIGKLEPAMYDELLQKIADEGDNLKLSNKQLGLVLQPQKPVYVNNDLITVNGTPAADVRNYIKSSSFPLIPQFTKNTKLDELRKAMEGEDPTNPKIDRVAYESAVKAGMTKQATPIDGSITTETLLANSKDLNREGFRIQQEVPFKLDKALIRDGSQQRVLLFANTLDLKIGDSTGQELKSEYDSIYGELYKEGYSKLMNKIKKGNVIDKKKLSDLLITEAIDRNYPFNDIYTLGYDKRTKNFRIPLWANPSSSKIEALINGVVNKQIFEQEMNGNSFILGSEAGTTPIKTLKELKKSEKNGIVYTDKYDHKKGLQFRDEDGFAQIMIQNRIKGKNGKIINLRKFMKGDVLDPSKLPSDVLEGMGFRIPTQGHNSMAKVRIVGFLPDILGDLVIAPKEFVVQMGSDFDVDKLFIRFHNTIQRGDQIIKVENKSRKGRENRLLDISLQVLGADSVQAMKYAPLDFGMYQNGTTGLSDRQNNLVKTISEAKGELDYKVNPIGPTYQRNKYIEGRAGQAGIGVFSLDSTFNTNLQVTKEWDDSALNVRLDLADDSKHLMILGGFYTSGDLSSPYTLRTKQSFNMLAGNQGVMPGEIRYKSEVIAASQSASVDNANERILEKLNINNETFDVMRILAQLGYEEDIISAFINQPIVVEYTEEIQKLNNAEEKVNNAELLAYQIIQDRYRDQGGFDFTEISNDRLNKLREEASFLNFEELVSNISDRGIDAPIQQVLLEKFAYLSGIGKELGSIQQTTNTASSGLSPSGIENIEKLRRLATLDKSDFNNNMFPVNGKLLNHEKALIGGYWDGDNIEAIEEEGQIEVSYFNSSKNQNQIRNISPRTINGHAAIYALKASQELMNELFNYDKTLVRKMFRDVEIHAPGNRADITSVASRRERVFKAFKRYVYSGVASNVSAADRMQLFFDTEGNESVASKVKRYQELPMFRDNTLIQRLKPYVKQGDKPSTIGYNASAVENEAEDDIYASFISLVADPQLIEEGYTTRDFADDLVKSMFLGDAIQEATQFVRYTPVNYITKGSFMGQIMNVNWRNKHALYTELEIKGSEHLNNTVNEFTRQFVQHNPWEAVAIKDSDLYKSKNGDDVIAITEKAIKRIAPADVNGNRELPTFIAIENDTLNKKYALYEYKKLKGRKRGYVKIETLGTSGMTEYSFMQKAETNIAKNKPVKKQVAVTTKDIDSQQEALFEADQKMLNKHGGATNVNENKVPVTDQYKLSTNEKIRDENQAVMDGLKSIIAREDSKNSNRLLATEFLKVAKDRAAKGDPIAVEFTSLPDEGKGASFPDQSRIQIDPKKITSTSDFEHTFLHELGHQMTRIAAIEGLKNNSKAAQRLLGYAKVFKNEFDTGKFDAYIESISDSKEKERLRNILTYITNPKKIKPNVNQARLDEIQVQELTSFAMSNPHVQTLLKSVKYTNTNQTFWEKLLAAWGNLLTDLGISNKENLLSATLADTFSLIQEGIDVDVASEAGATPVDQSSASAQDVAGAIRDAEEFDKDMQTPKEGDTHTTLDLLPGFETEEGMIQYPAAMVEKISGHKADKIRAHINSKPQLLEDIANAVDAEGTNVDKALDYYVKYKVESGSKLNVKTIGTINDMVNFRRYAEMEAEENLRGPFTEEEMKRAKKLLPLIQRGLLPLDPKRLAKVMAQIKMC
jgi:hypothetical protein